MFPASSRFTPNVSPTRLRGANFSSMNRAASASKSRTMAESADV